MLWWLRSPEQELVPTGGASQPWSGEPGAHQHLLFLSSGRARPSPRSHWQAQRGGGLGPGVHPEEAASMKWISQSRRREGWE